MAGSSCPICPLSKTVLNLSVACSSAELGSVTDQPPNQPMQGRDRATQALLSWSRACVEQLQLSRFILSSSSQYVFFLRHKGRS